MDYNPYLQAEKVTRSNDERPKGNIETIGSGGNIINQTRATSPTKYENELGAALEDIFGSGVTELMDVIKHLNDKGILSPNGTPWVEQTFRLEMARLGY